MGNSEKNFEGNVREQESNQGIFPVYVWN
jgi:hypothetical protein